MEPSNTISVYQSEEEIWRDADLIAFAVNPLGVGGSLVAAMRRLSADGLDHRGVCRHPAVLVMFDVLAQIMRRENWPAQIDCPIDAYTAVAAQKRSREVA